MSTLELLFRTARIVNEQALNRVRRETGMPVRPAHTQLFPHIDAEGTRITDIAQKIGISKQAVAKLVAELEKMEWLEKISDPRDGRAKLVRFTPGALDAGMLHLSNYESDIEVAMGHEQMSQLTSALERLLRSAQAIE